MKNSTINFGSGVKALGKGKIAGHLVLYGDEESADLAGEWFTPSTDFDVDLPAKSALYYHHGLDATLKTTKLGVGKLTGDEDDELGIWVEGQLDLRDRYSAAVYKMVEDELLGWSSGTASHLVAKKDTGEIERWPLGLDASLTPTPCDPRNLATVKSWALKSLPTFAELLGEKPTIKSDGPSADDKRRMIAKAVQTRLQAENPLGYVYAWVADVFEATVVYEAGGKYYEAPYTLDGLAVSVSDGVEVVQQTSYVAAKSDLGSPRLSDDARTATKAVKGYLGRLGELRARRAPQGRDLSESTVSELKGLRDEIDAFLVAAPTSLRAELDREFLKSMRPRTTLK